MRSTSCTCCRYRTTAHDGSGRTFDRAVSWSDARDGPQTDAAHGADGDLPEAADFAERAGNKVYPYLLRNLEVTRPNQVWCSDITYIPMRRGFAYLVVIMDWHSRAVLGWRISNTLDTASASRLLQGARATAGVLAGDHEHGPGLSVHERSVDRRCSRMPACKVSMDGKGCWIDNVFVERLWRSLKYEDIYLREYLDVRAPRGGRRPLARLSTTTNGATRRWTTRLRGTCVASGLGRSSAA